MSRPIGAASWPVAMLSALRALPRTVWLLGCVSLLNDAASDLVYPLLPLYLATLPGAGAQALGLIEGCAEAVASLLKLASGVLADRHGSARPWVIGGYGLAALTLPLIALASGWPMVLALRVGDRIGKGLRSSPRDALLARSVAPAQRGLAFGVHRAMDNAGAVAGPLLAAALLGLGVPLRELFLWTAMPGALTLWLIWRVPETPVIAAPASTAPAPAAGAPLPPALRRYLAIYALFSLGNASNLFLLWRAHELGLADAALPLLWALVSAVAMLGSAPLSGLSDRIGRRRLIAGGWTLFALVYALLGWPGLPPAGLW
ncbi:MAG TPA: MFS transporter, partial [Plasticicumulans sp.]|nr:MFS transporter [Plasticicumulans sp.]